MKISIMLNKILIPLLLVSLLSACLSDSEKAPVENTSQEKSNNNKVEESSTSPIVSNSDVVHDNQSSNQSDASHLVKVKPSETNYGLNINNLSKEDLEQKLKDEYANIDPLEYYLHQNPKYTDKKAMHKKQNELEELIKVYKSKYYDKGHLQGKRDNNAVLVSLLNNTYPELLYKKYDSISNKSNASLTEFKRNESNSFNDNSNSSLSELNRSVQLLKETKYSEASTLLSRLLSTDLLNNYLANYNKAYASLKLNDFQEAIKYANRSVLSRSDFYLGYLLLGECYLSIGDFNQAFNAFKKALTIKENVVCLERTAYASSLKGDYDEAILHYSRILEIYRGLEDLHNYTALNAFGKITVGKQSESISTSKYLSKTQNNWAVPSLIVAWNELYSGNNNEAEKYFNQAAEMGELFYSKLGLAVKSYNAKDFSGASSLFKELNRNEEFNKFKYHKGLLIMQIFSHANNQDFYSAYEKLTEYAKHYKKDYYYYLGMSLVSYDNFDFKSSETYLDSIKSSSIFETDYLFLKGVTALRNNNYGVAKSYFNRSLKSKFNLRALNGLGGVFNELEDYKSAMIQFEEGLLVEPNNPYLLFNKASSLCLMGKDYYKKGDTLNARQTVEFGRDLLRKAKSLDPRFIIDLNIGNAYSNILDSTTAIRYYNLVGNNYSNVNIGVVNAFMNNLSKAKEIWETIEKNEPSVELAKINLAASTKPNPKYTYYYYYYYDVSVDVKVPVPVLFDDLFEPLVPLGHSSFQFLNLTKD
jgi:tetratricopeptide (TPR) repeat protein